MMEEYRLNKNNLENSETPIHLKQTSDTDYQFSDYFSEELKFKFKKLQLHNLLELLNSYVANVANEILPKPIRILDFEMLEAELINQAILPKSTETLSQILAREVSHLKWTARDLLQNDTDIELLVDVRSYLLKKAHQNLDISDSGGLSIDFLSNQEIRYLDLFATYLNGAYEEANNSYEKGLNVILKTIRGGSLTNDTVEDQNKLPIKVILPIDKRNLVKILAKSG